MTIEKENLQKDVRQRILDAALKEFSIYGFNGTRMERIAGSAKITKAMIFYYFSSKKNLYQLVVKQLFDQFSPAMLGLLKSEPSPEEFVERVVDIYIDTFSRNLDFVRLLFIELIQNPDNITSIFVSLFKEKTGGDFGEIGPPQLIRLVDKWYSGKLITESNPYHMLINIISLSVLSFIGRPFMEALFRTAPNWAPPTDEDFRRQRIESVVNLLKNGLLA